METFIKLFETNILYQLIVCHFFLGICCYMGREWELSYRLGMRRDGNFYRLASNACPEKTNQPVSQEESTEQSASLNQENPDSNLPPESGELQGKRRRLMKGFALPNSNRFLTIVEERKQDGNNVYMEFMEKMKIKKQDYTII